MQTNRTFPSPHIPPSTVARRPYPPARYPTARTAYPYPYPVPTRPARRSPQWKHYGLLLAAAAGLFALAMLSFFLLGGLYSYYMISGRVLPGVMAGPVQAGSLTRAQLELRLQEAWNQQSVLVYSSDGHGLPAAPAALGLSIDAQGTAGRALQVGRGPGILQQIFWLARFGAIPVEPVVHFDPLTAQAGLEQLAAQINQPARNASLQRINGQWTAVAGQNGSSLNIEATLRRIAADPGSVLLQGGLEVVSQPVAPRISDLTPVIDRLRQAVEHPLVLQAYDPITDETLPVDIPTEVFAGWVSVEPQGDDFTIGLDAQQVSAYLQTWKAILGEERTLEPFVPPADLDARWQNGRPVTVLIRHNPTSYIVQAGDTLSRIAFKVGMPYWKIQQANPGIDIDQLQSGQTLVIPSKNEMLPLPVIPGKRIVISISQQHMWTYEQGALRSEHVISTGIDRSPTIPGVYQIQTHELLAYASVWDLTMPHFMGIYEGWPGFMNGIHGLPTLSSGRRLWAGNLGRPISYGCIVMGLDEAEGLYNWAEEGVVVEIQP